MELILELLQDTTRIAAEEEVKIYETTVCLLCGDSADREYHAKEVTQVSKLGEVKITRLVSDNGDRPAYEQFEFKTHRSVCPVCTPRLRRLSKGQLVSLLVKLGRIVGYEAQRRGVADISDITEIKRR